MLVKLKPRNPRLNRKLKVLSFKSQTRSNTVLKIVAGSWYEVSEEDAEYLKNISIMGNSIREARMLDWPSECAFDFAETDEEAREIDESYVRKEPEYEPEGTPERPRKLSSTVDVGRKSSDREQAPKPSRRKRGRPKRSESSVPEVSASGDDD